MSPVVRQHDGAEVALAAGGSPRAGNLSRVVGGQPGRSGGPQEWVSGVSPGDRLRLLEQDRASARSSCK